MPVQIGRLQNLQTLTNFVVAKQHYGPGIGELAKFPHLRGKLSILKLQNVKDAREALDANLKSKNKIEDLTLESDENTEDSKIEKEVLFHLQPSTDLRELTIKGYGGTSFPNWLGDSSFCNMVSLCIGHCCFCFTLPPLGQLPSRKKLHVFGMKLLESLGPEFYGQSGVSNPSFVPFASLEHLEFRDMENWEEWLPLPTEGRKDPFPHLKSLCLNNCPKLREHLPSHLPCLSRVEIYGCYELKTTASTPEWLTYIKQLKIEGGDQWSLLGDEHDSHCSLRDLSIRYCGNLPSLPKMIRGCNCLESLTLQGIPSLTCFPIGGLPTSLRSLEMRTCPNLAFLPPETWCNYTSLASLTIWYCDSLTSFPLDSFPALQHLEFYGCRNLESVSISVAPAHHPSRLSLLCIWNCEKLRSLPERIHTLTNLHSLAIVESLEVRGRERLWPGAVADWGLQHLTSLSLLYIGGDDIVNALLEEPSLMPNSLVSLKIMDLSNLKSIKGNEFQCFTSLHRLELSGCESISEDGLRCFTNLEYLSIQFCPRLESLPENGIRHLTNLKELDIWQCPMLESLPEPGLPASLSKLSIRYSPLLKARYQSQQGKHWSKIAHIPIIRIDDEVTI